MRRFAWLPLFLLALAPGISLASTWDIDPAHSSVEFSVRHLMVSTVKGNFQKVSGFVDIDDKNITKSSVEVTIEAASIDTREPKRDGHLKSPDFFDAAKYPTVTFKSTKVEKAGNGKLKVTGDLSIHGVTKPVVLMVEGLTPEVKDPWGNARRGASATTSVNRKDFGVSWAKTMDNGGAVVGEEVAIQLEAEFVRK
jgi:polyisoprenoid-binding protein YceI